MVKNFSSLSYFPAVALGFRVQEAMGAAFGGEFGLEDPVIRSAADQSTSDFQANCAFKLAGRLKRNSLGVAEAIAAEFSPGDPLVSSVEVSGWGFIIFALRGEWGF